MMGSNTLNFLRLCKFLNKREFRNFYEWFNCNYKQALCYGILYRKLFLLIAYYRDVF